MVTILVKNTFEFVHCWPEAPDEVDYLRSPHRHLFAIESEIEVGHDDRELEFIMVQHSIKDFLHTPNRFALRTSCEQIARAVGDHIAEKYGEREIIVTVYEDNENGARVHWTN